jgi:hypothetical protein
MRRQAASWVAYFFLKGILIPLLGAAALGGCAVTEDRSSDLSDTPGDSSAAPIAPDDADAPFHPPFTQYPEDPGALQFDDLPPAEQERTMRMAERTDYGPDVHGAWSAVARSAAADAAARRAAYASGINGIDEIGVK